MTIPEYKAKFGAEFREQSSKPWFAAFLFTLNDAHPLRTMSAKGAGDRLAGAAVFLNEIKGYQDCIDNISEIQRMDTTPTEEQEPTYTGDPVAT